MNQAILCLLGLTAMVAMCFAAQVDQPEYNKGLVIKKLCFKECRKVESRGKLVACGEDETAVKCRATGSDGCGASQMYNGQGCKINSCDLDEANGFGVKIVAICCKETEHNWIG